MTTLALFLAALAFVSFVLWRDAERDIAYWRAESSRHQRRFYRERDKNRELLERLCDGDEDDEDEADWWKKR